jgi:hypothetical protein
MKKIIILSVSVTVVLVIFYLHEEYSDNDYISFLYGIVKIFSAIGIIKLIRMKKQSKSIKTDDIKYFF